MAQRGGFRGKLIPQKEKDYVLANYGYMNHEQIARDLGYFRDGKPNKDKVKAIIQKHATESLKAEFEKRFRISGIRKQGSRFTTDIDLHPKPILPPPPDTPEAESDFLWGEFENDYFFRRPTVKRIGHGKDAMYCYYQPKYSFSNTQQQSANG